MFIKTLVDFDHDSRLPPWHVTSYCLVFPFLNIADLSEMRELASMVVSKQSCPLPDHFCSQEVKSFSPSNYRWDSKQHRLWSFSSWPYCASLGCLTALPPWLRTATVLCLAGSTYASTRDTAGAVGTCQTTLRLLVSFLRLCSRPWGCWQGWSTQLSWRWRCAGRWWRDTMWGRPPPLQSACQGPTHRTQRDGGESEQKRRN